MRNCLMRSEETSIEHRNTRDKQQLPSPRTEMCCPRRRPTQDSDPDLVGLGSLDGKRSHCVSILVEISRDPPSVLGEVSHRRHNIIKPAGPRVGDGDVEGRLSSGHTAS